MSNLGWYQVMTSMAKKVGGPKRFMGLLIGGGAILGGGAVAGGNSLKKRISANIEQRRRTAETATIYTVAKEGKSNEGLLFQEGDTFRVLEVDGDAALIEIIGNKNNPYFVSREFLRTISDYKDN